MARNRWTKLLRTLLIAAFWLALWQGIYMLVQKEILLVSPFTAFSTLWGYLGEGAFWRTVFSTIGRILGGYLAAIVAGVLLAALCHASSFFSALLSPNLTIVRTTPVASFIILLLVWMVKPLIPSFISFLIVLPVIWANVQEGLENTDPELLEMAKAFRLSRWKRARYIYLPAVLPYLMAGASTGLGMAWKSGVTAEVMSGPLFSIGKELNDAKVYLETADLFAWTVVVILLSIALEKILLLVIQKALKKASGEL